MAFKNILLFGAGKSATVLIQYLLQKSYTNQWKLTVVDASLQLVQSKIQNHPNGIAASFDVQKNKTQRTTLVAASDIVISMLLPDLHYTIALDCIYYKKHLLTASYIDDKIQSLAASIKRNQLLFLCEMGLDPGIDHMSAMQIIDKIKSSGGRITSFKSHCGGLIAPENDNNPWHYKITWNPTNLVNAGKTGAIFKHGGNMVQIDYSRIFKDNPIVHIPNIGAYAAYPNRNAIPYSTLYRLEDAPTFIRTTLRHPDFCKGWQHIVSLRLTDDNSNIKHFWEKPILHWLEHCITTFTSNTTWKDYLKNQVPSSDQNLLQTLFTYLNLNSQDLIPPTVATSSALLQYLLENKLALNKTDKDLIIMLHEIEYILDGQFHTLKSNLVVKGDNYPITAMAKTVGLPLAIAAELVLNNSIAITGLHIPICKEIYEPVLTKLIENKICFSEI